MSTLHPHGPENAEHEIKKAYNCIIDLGVAHFWDRQAIPGVNPYEAITLYRRAYDAYRSENRLAAERWSRTAKHLTRAFYHEAKIGFLEPRALELPFLREPGEEYGTRPALAATTSDLLDSIESNVPTDSAETSENMRRYLARARKHLEVVKATDYSHELLRAERVLCAHEYGRVVECMQLALEAEGRGDAPKAA